MSEESEEESLRAYCEGRFVYLHKWLEEVRQKLSQNGG